MVYIVSFQLRTIAGRGNYKCKVSADNRYNAIKYTREWMNKRAGCSEEMEYGSEHARMVSEISPYKNGVICGDYDNTSYVYE